MSRQRTNKAATSEDDRTSDTTGSKRRFSVALLGIGGWIIALLLGTGLIPTIIDLELRRSEASMSRVELAISIRERLTSRVEQFRRVHEIVVADSLPRMLTSCYEGDDGMRTCMDDEIIDDCDLMTLIADDVTQLEIQLASLEEREPRVLIDILPPCRVKSISVQLLQP